MGAEWNKYIDSTPLRIALIAVGLVIWGAAVVALLAAA